MQGLTTGWPWGIKTRIRRYLRVPRTVNKFGAGSAPEEMIKSAAVIAASLLVLTSCGSAAAHKSAIGTPTASASGTAPYWSSGPSASGGPSPSGATGPFASTYPTVSGASGPHPGCNGIWSYNLCIPFSAYTGPSANPAVQSDLGFSCRIAISNGSPGSGGFIKFPGGDFTTDPRSNVSITYPPGTQPGMGGPQLSFSSASGRWYPVTREAVSPDGSRYAYMVGSGIHIVTAANGADTVIGTDKSWRLVLLVNNGAYAAPGDQATGLWFVPLSGSPKQIIDTGWWMTASASSGIAYGQRAQSVPPGANNPILRLSLSSGAVQTWWSAAPGAVQLSAVAPDGSLIVSMPSEQGGSIVDIRRIAQPEQVDSILAGPNGYLMGPVVADYHGIWLTINNTGANASYTWFAPARAYAPASKVSGQLASGCD